jgi:excisionase family DNA binding protein
MTLMNRTETAQLLRIARSTLDYWLGKRKIPFIKLGGRVLFDKDQVIAFVDQHRIPVQK